ncbi:hypothetical protein [Melittangium boletus]|uniref:Uncharacterized protein n=1 Tax=Melittangium boletus DSM 14713 TaxID=1294270 RepID=A0A250IGV4_9BACT|nr:hypothetical protein [Melittangium boletus]ATB30387.1 hypothetical protein MEBOL_003848 [Melittangium boletus DSM 14713]
MIKIAFQGLIHSGDFKTVSNLMTEWVQAEKLKLKVKLSGDEIVYEDEHIYFYCHSAMAEPLFLLEGSLSGTLAQAKALLQRLLQLCNARKIASRFDYAQVNEDGDEISEQFHVQ